MSAVQYVHTKRFQSELMAFFNHFSQIQESLRRMRTVAAGNEVAVASTRGTRMSLDISAGTPLIIFPKSSTSEDLLVANFGHMTLRNQFLFSGDEGTILRGLNSEEEDDELEIIMGEFLCLDYWLVGRSIGWFVGRSVHRSVRPSVRPLVGRSIRPSVHRSVRWSVGRSVVGRSVGLPVGQSVGRSVRWSVGPSVRWSVAQLVR
jgi:hypothetical protein